MKLKITCEGIPTKLSRPTGNVDLGLTLDLALIKPEAVIAASTVDVKKWSELLKKNSKELTEFIERFQNGDFEKANAILHKIGGTEEDFIKAEGGWIFILLIFGVALLWATEAK
jgi:hypothetical protein